MKALLAILLPGGCILLVAWFCWYVRSDIGLAWAMWRDARAGHHIDDIEMKERGL